MRAVGGAGIVIPAEAGKGQPRTCAPLAHGGDRNGAGTTKARRHEGERPGKPRMDADGRGTERRGNHKDTKDRKGKGQGIRGWEGTEQLGNHEYTKVTKGREPFAEAQGKLAATWGKIKL